MNDTDDILIRLGEVIGGKTMADDDHATLAEDAYAEIVALRAALDEALEIASWALVVDRDLVDDAEIERRQTRLAGLAKLTRKP